MPFSQKSPSCLVISFFGKQNLFYMGQWKAFAQFGIYLKICCSLPEQRKGIFDLDLCWLAVNLQGFDFS